MKLTIAITDSGCAGVQDNGEFVIPTVGLRVSKSGFCPNGISVGHYLY